MTRRFNPAEYRDNAMDLIKANPELAADAVTKLARRKHNADTELKKASEGTKDLLAFFGMTGVLALVGMWNGSMAAKREALIDAWEAGGASIAGANLVDADEPWKHEGGVSDPKMLFFVPKLLLVPMGFGLLWGITASMSKGKEAGTFQRFAALTTGTTAAYFVADWAGGWMFKKKSRQLAQAPTVSPIAATG